MADVFLGLLVFLSSNFALLYTSHLLTRKYLHALPSAARLVATGLLFYAFIIIILQALSPFHAISRLWVSASCATLAVAAHALLGRHRNYAAEIGPLFLWVKTALASRLAALIVICGFMIAISVSRALAMPPLAWDCLTYHLTFAALWIKHGTLLLFKAPDQIITTAHMPINGELLAVWQLLPFGTDIIANLMNFPITFLGGLASYALSRELGLSRKQSSWAPALICFMPVIYAQITTCYVDNAVFAFCTAAVFFAVRYLRKGLVTDVLLSCIATGILLGIKYTALPAVGLITISNLVCTLLQPSQAGFKRKVGIFFIAFIIICALGSRKYIQNASEAGNPLYPFPVKILGHDLFAGWSKFKEIESDLDKLKKEYDMPDLSTWEGVYARFLYNGTVPITAGPPSFFFLLVACISIFKRPPNVQKECWLFLSLMWLLPSVILIMDDSSKFTMDGVWVASGTRYFSAFITIFTIQALTFINRLSCSTRSACDYLFIIFLACNLFMLNKEHIPDIELFYPYLAFALPLIFFLIRSWSRFLLLLQCVSEQRPRTFRWHAVTAVAGFMCLVILIYLLQTYRDSTRYNYYRSHLDYHNIPRDFVNGWEFLDRPGQHKTIAFTAGIKSYEHHWFFYALMGRRLQNEIVYASGLHKWDVPTWLDGGLLQGGVFSTWLYNLDRHKVDYILVVSKPPELGWIKQNENLFKVVYDAGDYSIFEYRRAQTS